MSSECKLSPPQISIETKITSEQVGNAVVGTIISLIDVENIIECGDSQVIIQDQLPLKTLVYIRPVGTSSNATKE